MMLRDSILFCRNARGFPPILTAMNCKLISKFLQTGASFRNFVYPIKCYIFSFCIRLKYDFHYYRNAVPLTGLELNDIGITLTVASDGIPMVILMHQKLTWPFQNELGAILVY